MKVVKVAPGQTLIDIAVQELGDWERLFEVAKLNKMNITDPLVADQEITVPAFARDKGEIVRVFTDPSNKPASDSHGSVENQINEGIDYWAIGTEFIVS